MRNIVRLLAGLCPILMLMCLSAAGSASVRRSPVWSSSASRASWRSGAFYVNNDMWSGDAGPQRIWAYSHHHWGVISRQGPTSDVKVYPDVDLRVYASHIAPNVMTGMNELYSKFSQTMPPVRDNYSAEAAYDIWLNNWKTEVMIWVDTVHRSFAGFANHVATLSNGGQTWNLYQKGSGVTGYYAFELKGNETRGGVHALELIRYLVNTGRLPRSTTLTDAEFGWEICSTNNRPLAFTVQHYSMFFKR